MFTLTVECLLILCCFKFLEISNKQQCRWLSFSSCRVSIFVTVCRLHFIIVVYRTLDTLEVSNRRVSQVHKPAGSRMDSVTCSISIYPAERSKSIPSDFDGLEAACRSLVPKLAGSNPTEAVGFFRTKQSVARLPSVPCRRFTACKRSLNVTWKSGIFRQNSSAISRTCSSTFGC